MTAQEATARVSQSVVRIETDLVAGSGFIVDAAGLILTNNHVISGAEEITVYLKDGATYAGTVDARDMVRDLALVSINASELSPLELGDLSEVGLAEQVIVLGYPLGGENITVTSGLVSAIEFDSGRNITWVQTDSAINPGNSGGPLLDLQGRAIGVVSAKTVGWGIEGVGFAISANTVKTYLPRLQAGETIVNGE
jgi:serine protease Do